MGQSAGVDCAPERLVSGLGRLGPMPFFGAAMRRIDHFLWGFVDLGVLWGSLNVLRVCLKLIAKFFIGCFVLEVRNI